MLKLFVSMQNLVIESLRRDDRGATAVEYGLIVGLIAAVIIVTVGLLGKKVEGGFVNVLARLTAAL